MITLLKLIKTQKLGTELQKDIDTMKKANWKTNAFGAALILLAIAKIWVAAPQAVKIDQTTNLVHELGEDLGLLGAGGGLLAAKDSNN